MCYIIGIVGTGTFTGHTGRRVFRENGSNREKNDQGRNKFYSVEKGGVTTTSRKLISKTSRLLRNTTPPLRPDSVQFLGIVG